MKPNYPPKPIYKIHIEIRSASTKFKTLPPELCKPSYWTQITTNKDWFPRLKKQHLKYVNNPFTDPTKKGWGSLMFENTSTKLSIVHWTYSYNDSSKKIIFEKCYYRFWVEKI